MSDMIKELERLQKAYAEEIKSKQDGFKKKNEQLEKKLKDALCYDYANEYVLTYRVSLSALEKIYAEWESVQRRTKGLTFKIYEYINTLSPRTMTRGGLFAYVDRLVGEGRRAIGEVESSNTVDGDIEPQKVFCQCLVDLRYVVLNARSFIADTGVDEEKKQEAVLAVRQEIDALKKKEREQTRLENLDCYAELKDLKEKILSDAENADKQLIGNPLTEDECDFRFLVGFKKANVAKEAADFAKKVLSIPEKALSFAPVYFEPKTRNGVIVIRADRDYFEAEMGDDFDIVRKLYFSMLSSLGPKSLRFGGAETALESVVGAIAGRVKDTLGENAIFGGSVATSVSAVSSFTESLRSLMQERSNVYNGSGYREGIYEYNERTPDARHDFVLAVYNYAPDCFSERLGGNNRTFFQVLERGPSKGVFTIVRVAKDSDFALVNEKGKEIPADVIDIDGDEVFFNGERISVDITVEGFNTNDYLNYLADQAKKGDSLSLKKLLKKADERFAVTPIDKFTDALRIPLGISDGVWYDYTLKTCSTNAFGLLVGMTGSGKSAFLHTLIMSAAYHYAPDELQLYLVDFKSGETSPAFGNYVKGKPMYIPHVVYLSLRCKNESSMDLLNKIEFMIDERAKMMTESGLGSSDICEYNRSEEVLSGKLKKIPIALFVIDEYNNMFASSSSISASQKLGTKLDTILKRARAYGIEILFCGQDSEPLSACGAIEQIGTKLSLKVNSYSVFNQFFKLDAMRAKEYSERLKSIGTALISVTGNNGERVNVVKVAYAGGTTSSSIREVAERIRKKYENNPACSIVQAEAGNDALFPIGDYSAVAYKETEYALPLGASSANTLGVTMNFSANPNATGYCVLARETKLFEIERIALLSYISKFKKGSFVYAAGPADCKEFMNGFGSEKDYVSSCITLCSDPSRVETAEKILELKRICEERRDRKIVDNSVEFEPIYLVLHDVAWLAGSGTIGGKKKTEVKQPLERIDTAATEKSLGEKGVALKGSALAMLSRKMSVGATVEKTEQKSEVSKTYYVSEIKSAVTELYEGGSEVCVFITLAHETLSPLKYVCGNGDKARTSERFIYDSYEVLRALESDKSIENVETDETCCYDAFGSTRTRLFDYSPSDNPEWWAETKGRRN